MLSQAARVSQLCISHAPWPQPQELLSRVWGFFGFGNQACLMKQFVEGAVEKPSRLGGRMYEQPVQRERGVSKDRVQPVPALPHLAGLPQGCPGDSREGSSLHHRGLGRELPQFCPGKGAEPWGGHWSEPSSFPLQIPLIP